jgi:hypothetical protein
MYIFDGSLWPWSELAGKISFRELVLGALWRHSKHPKYAKATCYCTAASPQMTELKTPKVSVC